MALFLTGSANALHGQYEELEDFAKKRYPEEKTQDAYRNYQDAPEGVVNFYRQNHLNQTVAFVQQKKAEYTPLNKAKMSIWDVVAKLDTLVDESDPDLDLPQSYHFFQTAEALRKDGHPRWLILTGFIHDLGKILTAFGEPQWAIVGDSFPVGCAFSDKVVFSEFFKDNPDSLNKEFNTPNGIYREGCGYDQLDFSWGHDEYMYHVVKNYLPEEGAYIIRYHSFYAGHKEGAYQQFMNDKDRNMVKWLNLFSRYDLYSKSEERLDIESLRPYYEELVSEFFPALLSW